MYIPAVGDWITSYSPGVWQVCRVLRDFNELRYSLDVRKKRSKRVIVFSKRFLDGTWKPNFGAESCERSLVALLSPEDRARVESVLSADLAVRSAFEAYSPELISLIVNLSMSVPERSRLQTFGESVLAREIAGGIPMDRVLQLLQKCGLAQYIAKTPINATLQLFCHDHEVRDREFILRDWRVLPF